MGSGIAAINLLRDEHRFLLHPETGPELLVALGERWAEVRFSENLYAFTIYLESDEHEVPFGTSVKLRQFHAAPGLRWPDDLCQPFRFELKSTVRAVERRKTAPRYLTLGEAVVEARASLGIPTLRPYLAVQYGRRHFTPRSGTPLRFTVDCDTRYWYFADPDRPPLPLGIEDTLRLEAKVAVSDREHPDWLGLRQMLAALGALPINSKRMAGFARIGEYQSRRYGLPTEKDLGGAEIEAKLLVRHEDPFAFFREIKAWTASETAPILLARHFPYTLDAETVNQHWGKVVDDQLVDGLKILLRGDEFSVVRKADTEVLDPEFGIVRRREAKEQPTRFTAQAYRRAVDRWYRHAAQPQFLGHLHRWRRAIWPEDGASRRIYHISIDCCTASGWPEPLWQVEIEYIGRLLCGSPPPGDLDRVVVDEIRHLVRCLLARANRNGRTVLVPTTLTKFQWLAGA